MNNTKFRKIIKDLIRERLSEDYKGEPNNAAEVESDKLTATLSEYDNSEGNYPAVTLQVFTNGGKSTHLLLYKGDARASERSSDVDFKTSTPFSSIVRSLKSTSGTRQDEDVKAILRNLTSGELAELIREKVILTTNIPNEILDLTGKHVERGENNPYGFGMYEGVIIPKSSVQTLRQFVDSSGLDEVNMLGATTTPLSSDEMQAYLAKTVAGKKTNLDKYKMPYIHRGNVVIKDENNRTFDLDKLKAAIITRPEKLLKQNEKITHSGGESAQYFNIGLPALKGLAVDEKTGEFVVVDTCPGAGACQVYCYAKKGGYVQWKSSSMSQTRILNFLLNDPDGFKAKLESEIKLAVDKFNKKGARVVIRWHDAGDFFSPDYVNLAYSVAKKFPLVDFYAYTKMAGVATGDKPINFKMNFSMGAKPGEEKQINFSKTKHSTVVPKQMFTDLILKDADGKLIKDEDGKMQFKSPQAIDILKDKLAAKYNVFKDSIITYDEMKRIPVSTAPQWNVIVKPGDGDESANRLDVIGTWLLIH